MLKTPPSSAVTRLSAQRPASARRSSWRPALLAGILLGVGAAFPVARAAGVPGTATNHWSFQPLRAPVVPVVRMHEGPPAGPVDAFLLRRLEEAGARFGPPADRRTLIRRATYDLTGLPPTPEAIEAFERDPAPDAFARVVERLLASPQYGERMGRHWLDVVRYADTAGENSDHPLPHAWRYRNWVIDAFNRDMPYDAFIREQVAGDILGADGPPEALASRIVATGYLAIARRFGHDIDKDMHLTFEDAIDNLGKTFLGLSLGCARCHDHKYDPVSTRDYYGLYGILESTRFAYPGCEPNQLPRDLVPLLPPAEAEARSKPFQAELDRLTAAIKAAESELADARGARGELPRDHIKNLTAAVAEAKLRRNDFAARNAVPVAYAVVEGTPRNARVQKRGDPEQPGEEVPRKFLDLLGGRTVGRTNASGRLELARWIADPANPLTARVMVNRIWHWHFGRGLVPSLNDFGIRGQAPTHPELLDHLASTFVAGGWSVKAMHRAIMNSRAYQQASTGGGAIEAPAPEFYGSFPRRRLSAEELRDTLLAVTGELDREPGGAHPFPSEYQWSYSQHGPFADNYETFKRSVYVMQKRNRRAPFFALFDGADPNASTAQRDSTTVPTQALYLMNDPFVHGRAERLAERVLASGRDDRTRVDHVCRRLFGRGATAADQADAAVFLEEYGRACSNEPAERRERIAWAAYSRVLLASNELLHVD